MRIAKIFFVLSVLCIGLSAASAVPAENDWPRWRGENMDATVNGTGALHFDQGEGLKIVWKNRLGSGYSSVSLVDGRAVTMFSDSTFDWTIAFDATSGEEIWRRKIGETYKGHDGSHDGPIATPVIAGGKVFGLAPRGELFALDFETGKVVWEKYLPELLKAEAPLYGVACSPIVVDNVLIVQSGEKTIAGLNVETGAPLWSAGSDTSGYQSPLLMQIGGQMQLVCSGNKYVYGLEPKSGKILWEYKHGGGSGGANLVAMGDGKLFLSYKWSESLGLDIKKEGESFAVSELWKSRNIRNTYGPPVYLDGHLYGYSSSFLTCLDATTGESVWKSRQPGDGFLIAVDDHLVVATKTGVLSVAKASPTGFDELASVKVSDGLIWTPPSFAYGRIYLRGLEEIAAVEVDEVEQMVVDEQKLEVGPVFGKFLKQVASASDKNAVVEAFFSSQKQFPLVEGNLAHFIYRGKAEDVALGGDLAGSGHVLPMQRVPDTGVFYYSARLDDAALLSYNYTVDFENTVIDSLNPLSGEDVFGPTSYLEMPGFKSPNYLQDPPEDATVGRIDTMLFTSKIGDNERRIDIYLPAGYENSDASYPVIYVHFADQVLGPGQMKKSLDNLLGKSVTPLIAVFVHGAKGVRGELTGRNKENYGRMLAEELVPYIDANYRTVTTLEARANIGSCWAAMAPFYSAFMSPGVFGKVASQSPFIMEAEHAELDKLVQAAGPQSLQIYLDWGKYDLRSELEGWDIGQQSQALAEYLTQKGYKLSGGEAPTGFNWASWRTRTGEILETFFPLQSSMN